MKHLELFENHNERREFWKLPMLEDNYPVYLDKIGVPIKDIKIFLKDKSEVVEFYDKPYKYLYIGYTENNGRTSPWTYATTFQDYNSDHIYRGTPKITEEDIKNWEIKHTSGKYNL